ncbi:hypothetical protein NON20_06740 [Synechocystis sp. B12]|nr:hypothetical protein NON20_06740 [Synechocystis sp. B12]
MGKKPKSSFNVNQDDIPEVIRDNPAGSPQSQPLSPIPMKLIAAGLGIIILALLTLLAL